MSGHRKTNRYNSGRGDQGKASDVLDDLAEFQKFRQDILPQLRKMIAQNKSAEEIYKFAQSLSAARAVSIAVGSTDEAKALAAIKEVLDRGTGKAPDKLEITKKYEKLSDEELDALLESERQTSDEGSRIQ